MAAHESTASRRVDPGGVAARRGSTPPLAEIRLLRNHCRRGYTLLEMLLATVVSVLLLGALYVVMDTQIRYAQAGRDVIEESTLAHNLLALISNDIRKCVIQVALTPSPPLPSSTK